MAYYNLPVACPDCGGAVTIEKLGVNKEWQLAVNVTCNTCKKGGGYELEFAYFVGEAARLDGEEVSVQ